MKARKMQFTNCECLNQDHLEVGRDLWEGEIEDESLFEKTDTMTVTLMNDGKVALCTCGWCGYTDTVDLLHNKLTVIYEGQEEVIGSSVVENTRPTSDAEPTFIILLSSKVFKKELLGETIKLTTMDGVAKNIYETYTHLFKFSEWKYKEIEHGRILHTRDNGLFHEFKMHELTSFNHNYGKRELYADTGDILMDIELDGHKVYVTFEVAKAIAASMGISVGYRPDRVKEVAPKTRERYNFDAFSVRYGAMSKNNTRRIFMYGCDGTDHALWVCTEYLDDNLVTTFAKDEGDKIICKCNGSCKGKLSFGGFLSSEYFNN